MFSLIRIGLALLLFVPIGSNNLIAQGSVSLDLNSWLVFSARAERVIEGGNASNEAFLDLQKQLHQWNNVASQASVSAHKEIELLTSRVEALRGAATTQSEDKVDITALLDELNGKLTQSNSNLSLYTDISIQTTSLISRINAILNKRLEAQFYEIKPTPLNPSNWGRAFIYFFSYFVEGYQDIADAISSYPRRVEAVNNLSTTLVLGLLGLVFFIGAWAPGIYGRSYFKVSLTKELDPIFLRLRTFLQGFAFPILGVAFLVWTLMSTGFFDFKALMIIETIPKMVALIIGVNYLSKELYDQLQNDPQMENHEWLNSTRKLTQSIGLVLGFSLLVDVVIHNFGITPEIESVLLFTLIIILGTLLFLVSRNFIREYQPQNQSLWDYTTKYLSYFAVVVSIAGIILGAIGYTQLAQYILFSTAYTFAVFIGYWLALDLFTTSFKTFCQVLQYENLNNLTQPMTAIVGVVLTFVFGILLAVSWGATQADILAVWNYLLEGDTIGGQVISLTTVLVFLSVIIGGYLLTRVSRFVLSNSILEYTHVANEVKNAFLKVVSYVGLTITVIVAIGLAGIDLTNLALLISALSVGIGFGLQEVVSNFIAGIILLFERPINEGDWIEVGTTSGIVKKISVRSTTIETFDRSEVVVPNKDLMANAVKNWTLGSRLGRVVVDVGVAYGTSVEKVKSILLEIATNHPHVAEEPGPSVVFMRFGADALEFEIRAILIDVNYMISARSEINEQIQARFENEGIEIPFSQRDIWLRNETIKIEMNR